MKAYPAYKSSPMPWLDKVPEHWGIMPAFSVLREKQVKNKGMVENTVLSLSYGKIVIKPPEKLHGLVPESFETYQIVDPQDIIIRPTDLQNDWTSLRVGLSRHRGIITSAYICLKAFGEMTPEYAYLLLHTYDLLKVFYGMGSGLRQNLDFGDLKRMPVLIPSVAEQNAIVSFLDSKLADIDRYIAEKERLIELLQEQKTAIINQAVTKGLNPRVGMKDSGIEWLGEIPEEWEVMPLKRLAKIQTGITLGKNYKGIQLFTHPYLRVANVQDGYFDLSEVKTVDVPESEAKSSTLRAGDLLVTEGGDFDKLGRGFIWDGQIENCLHQNHIFCIRPSEKLEPHFLASLLASSHGRTYFILTSKQTTNLASTNSTTLKEFDVLLPSRQEQRKILEHIAEQSKPTDQAIERAKREIELIQEYRTALIAEAVTGRVKVAP